MNRAALLASAMLLAACGTVDANDARRIFRATEAAGEREALQL